MNLRKLLSEVLSELNLPKPEDAYPFDSVNKSEEPSPNPNANAVMYSYKYTNNNEDDMEITVLCEKIQAIDDPGPLRNKMTVAFSKYEKDPSEDEMFAQMFGKEDDDEYANVYDDETKYSEKTGANDFIKVLATVVEAVKKTADDYAKGIDNVYEIAFAPSDKKRKNVYDHYVQSLFPGWKKNLTKTSNYWVYLINKNYKGK